PIYVGGYAGYTGYYDGGQPIDPGVLPSQPGQPNVIVVYPQAPGGGPGPDFAAAPPLPDQPSPSPAEAPANATPATYYLIAFKDHTIYSAVAYWVEGDTLHYFTSGATHNQVSLSLVDRELTLRLNQEAGTNLQLPTN
ncbi:MAG: hypothetical protein JO323_23530, partial [Acidobacteriia bacterium]|nr:hypothetical protein [Terriglobia bacterium]